MAHLGLNLSTSRWSGGSELQQGVLRCPACHKDAEGASPYPPAELKPSRKIRKLYISTCMKKRRPGGPRRADPRAAPAHPWLPLQQPRARPAAGRSRCGTYRYCPLVAPGPGKDRHRHRHRRRSVLLPSPPVPPPGDTRARRRGCDRARQQLALARRLLSHPAAARPRHPAPRVGWTVPGTAGCGFFPTVWCETHLARSLQARLMLACTSRWVISQLGDCFPQATNLRYDILED